MIIHCSVQIHPIKQTASWDLNGPQWRVSLSERLSASLGGHGCVTQ